MKQLHDSQIGWQVLVRNLDKLSTVAADKGYDWELLRHKLRAEGVNTAIKHREFGWHGVATRSTKSDSRALLSLLRRVISSITTRNTRLNSPVDYV